jgi:hypothetical protein
MGSALEHAFGKNFIVRAPVPATLNRGQANFKSEVGHLEFSPRVAYEEWVGILEGIRRLGGDAILEFEPEDQPFLGHETIVVDGDGYLRPLGSAESLGEIEDVMTGRVFAANGPWIVRESSAIRAVLPNMIEHRKEENKYFQRLLWKIAEQARLDLVVAENPNRWEGMADVVPIKERVLLTFTVRGHYAGDMDSGDKVLRSSKKGLKYAADFVGVPESKRIYAELVYPHFHGDTVHFVVRPPEGDPRLIQYSGGLFDGEPQKIEQQLGPSAIVRIAQDDATGAFAANSRQVNKGLLVPNGVSERFLSAIEELGLVPRKVRVNELFGKAGGGPACATLPLPANIPIPETSPLRYSVVREQVAARRERIPTRLMVSSEYYESRALRT